MARGIRGTVTVLFTDLVGSTELRQRLGDDEAEQLRRAHFGLLRRAVRALGGEEVKNLGDGVMVAFPSTLDAIDCAVAMQQGVERYNRDQPDDGRRLRVRVGVHVGEPIHDERDYFGTTVDIASRLCDEAAGGQIVASGLVRELVGSRGGHTFNDLGARELKGIARPLPAYEVAWSPAPAGPGEPELQVDTGALPLPPLLASYEPGAFVGRETELGALHQCWNEVRSGRRRLFLLAGDPGIGKTRLAAQFARMAHEDGAAALLGQCYEEALIPYQPFVEALRYYVLSCPPATLRAQVGANGPVLARLLPELARRLPELTPDLPAGAPGQSDPESERYWFFEAIASLLIELSRERPLLVILDDLHWADKPTLQLLKHIVRAQEQSALLMLGTYRETELGRTHPLADSLADLRRPQGFERCVLEGLTAGEIERMVASWAGGKAPEALVEAITVRTLGNPLFIREVLANLAETDVTRGPEEELPARLASLIEEHGIPEGIKEVIGRRLSRLSEPCNAVLALAAVMGREFRSSVLEQVSDLSSDALLDALDEAVGAQLVTEASRVGRYAFAHPLTRETLYAELSAARRVRMHRRIGEALEELRPDEQEAHLSELAHHFLQAAGDRRDIDKAVSYARRAGDRARALFAYEEAAAHYERALQALELSDTPDLEERFELLLRLGVTARNAGDTQKKSAALDEAVRVARQSGSPLLFARAVLSLRDGYAELGLRGPDEAYVALLHEALDGLGERDAALRSQLLCYLAGEYYTSTDDERRLVTSREAVATARLANDPDALAFALGVRHYCLREPEHANERRAIVLEILELATATGTKRLALNAYTHQVEDLLHAGDVEGADRSLAARERLAAEMRVHSHLLHTQQLASMRALLDGRFDDAERLMNEALQLGQQTGSRTSFGIYNLQTFLLRKEQGRLAEIEAAHRSLAERFGELPSFRCALALLECELGQVEEARREFNAIAGQHFADIPRDTNWIIPIVFLAEVCATLRDRDRAEELFGLLTSYRGSNIVVAYATLSLGPASRYLGLLAATMARWEEASQLFDESAAMSERMRAKPWLARTHADLARMLLSRKATGDRERACELMDEAQRVAEALGMRSLLAQVHSMRELA